MRLRMSSLLIPKGSVRMSLDEWFERVDYYLAKVDQIEELRDKANSILGIEYLTLRDILAVSPMTLSEFLESHSFIETHKNAEIYYSKLFDTSLSYRSGYRLTVLGQGYDQKSILIRRPTLHFCLNVHCRFCHSSADGFKLVFGDSLLTYFFHLECLFLDDVQSDVRDLIVFFITETYDLNIEKQHEIKEVETEAKKRLRIDTDLEVLKAILERE